MSAYDELLERLRDIDLIGQIGGLVSWDQEVLMPPKAAGLRAEQLAWISKTGHQRLTNPRIGELLDELEVTDGLNDVQTANVRLARESYDKATKLPTEFVEEMAKHRSKAQISWSEARAKDDFSIFRDDLAKSIDLARRKADYLGYDELRYDALLDIYESGLTVARVDPLFAGLRDNVAPLIKAVVESGNRPDISWVEDNSWEQPGQEALSQGVSEAIGFDFSAGRRDASTHPFCGGPNPDDVRWTTRYSESDPFGSLYGSMHETGHGTYEQGRRRDLDFQPAGEANGLGVHESQSRLWENQIGRSREFCEWALPMWQKHFPQNMDGVDSEALWQAVNLVEPSLIRVEADEATYNMHIMIRYEIEKKLIAGDLEIDDLPDAWDDMYEEFLGIRAPNRTLGVLQDIHWSMGAFGYFPTYTLGNLYSAQLLAAARKDLPDHDEQMRCGEFGPLLDWMREHVHQRGSILEPADLIEEATGSPPSPDAFVDYLKDKVEQLYGVSA
ncbi:MAG: carboxypeptidase M32 [Candidatus Poseidoniales archaeon]|jgi:carboxypeptidase Taq|nr:carboxypeptidase M32 [Candidatus Poseidoniales archaeon]|tara:strand:- start:724 stop:2226 length:1503 start_codon:yes stop_codon:yes gene_type:complete